MIRHLPQETMARVFEEVGLGVTIVGIDGEVRWANTQATELLGWSSSDVANSVMDCHPERSRDKVREKIAHGIGKEWHRVLERNGRTIENQYFPIDLDGQRGMMIVTRDVTEREAAAQALRTAAITDGLTGLFNRQRLNEILASSEDADHPIGVIVADLNGLKVVNDQHGHLAGDDLIIRTAELLRQSVRKSDMVFRIGGDEFLVLIYDDHPETVSRAMDRVITGSDCSRFGTPGHVCLSIGACLLAQAPDLETAISTADQRMYEAKRSFYEAAATENRTPRN
ncbi:MAG: diguanylate cyclase [Bacillota bacterium]